MKLSIAPASQIVTFLVLVGLSACSSGPKRSEQPAAEAPTTMETQVQKPETKVKLRQSHPRKYTVKKGDTLWDISSLFLRDPWYWPEIWHQNQQVKNPHLIYPGDVLTLIYVNGQPRVMVEKPTHATADGGALPVVKLSPSIRREGLEASIATIPGDAIRQFLTRPRVVTKKELEQAPYILASDDEHLILGEGNKVYVRGELDKERVRYTVFRPGEELVDPESGEILGYEAIYAGETRIDDYGDPATGKLMITEREVLLGDRLLPLDKSKIDNLYFPRPPDRDIKGQIISLFDALFGIGKFQIAVINRGGRDGLEVGHLLETQTKGERIQDRFDPRKKDNINLPNERSGLMMVFRIFDHVSYGLILESTRVIHNHDVVANPR